MGPTHSDPPGHVPRAQSQTPHSVTLRADFPHRSCRGWRQNQHHGARLRVAESRLGWWHRLRDGMCLQNLIDCEPKGTDFTVCKLWETCH